jgi:drug/metabolite transporter (DMT)-like permease
LALTAADIRRLLLLSALWGGSFIFIRVAVPVFGPVVTVEARVLIAGLALLGFAAVSKAPLGIRSWWRQYLLVGLLNSAVPFVLISTAELHITASMAAILNATSPLFGALVSAVWLGEPLTVRKVGGIAIAIAGIAILVGWSPLVLSTLVLLSIGASLLAALFYGIAGAYTKTRVKGAPPLGVAAGSQLGASVLLAFVVPFAPPTSPPTAAAAISVLLLALLCTASAYVLYFRLIVDVGPTKALTVTFLAPIFGVLWGALFLGEAITWSKGLACAIILCGTAFVTHSPVRAFPSRARPITS